mgnify:CR=1 FL=1
MGNGDAGFGQDFFQSFFAVLNGVYFVVQKVNLPAAFELTQNGFTTLLKDRDFISLTLKTTF